MLLDKYYRISKYKQMIFSFIYLIQWKKNSFFSKGGGGRRQWDLYMLLMLLFLW